MSCTSCGTTFSFLKKEHCCKMCGFAFCGKCCNVKVIVPAISEKKKQQICKCCSAKLNNKSTNVPNKMPSPPLALQRRMDELETGKKVHIDQKVQQPNPDKELAARLEKLKDRPKVPIVSDRELRERLSQLKGIPASPQSSSKNTSSPVQFGRTNSATEVEQSEFLLRQVQQQVKLETSRPNVDSELAERLQKLRQKSEAVEEPQRKVPDELHDQNAFAFSESHRSQDTSNQVVLDDDEESEAARLVQQVMEKVALDKETGCEDDEDLNTSEKEDEFPWCIICTGDAQIRCLGCEMDLYCHRCHKECHDKEDLCDHKTIPYEK